MALKHLVFALAVAAASAVAPFPRGSTEAVGDTFEMGKAVAKNDATLAVDVTPKLRGGAEGMAFRPAGRGLDFGHTLTDEPTAEPTGKPTAAPTAEPSSKPTTAEPTAEPTTEPTAGTLAPTLPVGGPAAAACLAAGGDCNSCCGGCTKKTPTDAAAVGYDFSTDPSLAAGECVCFEGALPGDFFLTASNDCAKVRGSRIVIRGREGNDAIVVDGDRNRLRGGDGNDVLIANGNSNDLKGDGGDDLLSATYGRNGYNYAVEGGDGYDTCFRVRERPQDPWTYTDGYNYEDDDPDDCEFGFTP